MGEWLHVSDKVHASLQTRDPDEICSDSIGN